jgi:O-antigen/teichoic acid export membrane protein
MESAGPNYMVHLPLACRRRFPKKKTAMVEVPPTHLGRMQVVARRIAPLAVLFLGTAGTSTLAYVIQLTLARTLAVAEFGLLSAMLAAVNLATPVGNFGIPGFWLQTFGREGWQGFRWVSASLKLFMITSVLSAAALAVYVLLGTGFDTHKRHWVMLCGIAILLGQCSLEVTFARLQLEGRFLALVCWQVIAQAGRLAVVLGALRLSTTTLDSILGGYAWVGAMISLAGLVLLRDVLNGRLHLVGHVKQPTLGPAPSEPTLRGVVARALPFALITIFYLVYFQSVLILLNLFVGAHAAGLYQAALLVIMAIYLVPQVVYEKFMVAKICRWVEHDRRMLIATFHLGVLGMAVAGLICMVAAIALAKHAIPWIYGSRYNAAANILFILSLGIPIRFVQHVYSSLFVTDRNMLRKVRYAGLTALVCLISNIALLPTLGVYGAAISAIVAEMAALLLVMQAASRFIDGVELRQTVKLETIRSSLRTVTLKR